MAGIESSFMASNNMVLLKPAEFCLSSWLQVKEILLIVGREQSAAEDGHCRQDARISDTLSALVKTSTRSE